MAIELSLAVVTSTARADFASASEHAGRALALAEQLGEPGSLAEALAIGAMFDFLLGRGVDEAKIEAALRLEDPDHQVPVQLRPSMVAGGLALHEGRLERCDQLLSRLRGRIVDGGRESDLPLWTAISSGRRVGAAIWPRQLATPRRRSTPRRESKVTRCDATRLPSPRWRRRTAARRR